MTVSSHAAVRFVLIEPQHPGNIGAVARAMKNMGLRHLAWVAPARYPDPEAVARASGADDLLAAAEVFPSLDQAIADCRLVIGTSARGRSLQWPGLNRVPVPASARPRSVRSRSCSGETSV
jgi:TrmH family RNA methyltransferase